MGTDNSEEAPILKAEYTGSRCTVIHCEGALESYYAAMAEKSQKKAKIRSMASGISNLIERLANGEPLSRDSFPPEGELPNKTKFHAFKRIPIRVYIWASSRRKNVWYISHYKFKTEDALDPRDTARVNRNWTRIEVDYEER